MATQDGTSAESEAEIRKLSTELHAKAQAQDDGVKVYTQEDLMALGVIPDNELTLLMSCINVLSSEGLVKVMSKDNRPCFKIQSKQDAARYAGRPSHLVSD
jgi:DNA-directed RNA polymerase III subunit RPC6